MNLDIEINKQPYSKNNTTQKSRPSFKGPLDGAVTQTLIAINTNPMVNAAAVDVGSMVIPRTCIDTKKRNKFAGFETFFRELTGTVIVCLSAGVTAMGIATVHNKVQDKEINISSRIWATNDTFDALKEHWLEGGKDVKGYVKNVLSNISGTEGSKVSKWNDIDWKNVQWYDDVAWKKIKWQDEKWQNITKNTKNADQIIEVFDELIKDKNASKRDVKNVIKILEQRISNSIRVEQEINLSTQNKTLSTSLQNLVRDTHDLGKEIFNSGMDLAKGETKLKSINRFKSIGAVALVSALGLGNQAFNRYLTKKRTGKDDFVGNKDYTKNVSLQKEEKNKAQNKQLRLAVLKALASAGILALSLKVMKINSFKEFIKKIELKSAITSGNAIKTIFTATLIGRFLAARDETELRESCTRDYLAFINWLVLGNFVEKGVAKLLDKNKELFNIAESNKVSLKSYREIAAKGAEFAKANIWKRNIAVASGLLYSGLALGCAIPLFNIFVTNRNKKQPNEVRIKAYPKSATFTGIYTFPKVFDAFSIDKEKNYDKS